MQHYIVILIINYTARFVIDVFSIYCLFTDSTRAYELKVSLLVYLWHTQKGYDYKDQLYVEL